MGAIKNVDLESTRLISKSAKKEKMDKKRLLWLISGLVLAVLIGALLFFSANAVNNNNNNEDSSHWRQGKNWKPFMNFAAGDRRQIMETRMQVAAEACQSKAEGDACTVMTTEGLMGNIGGTCKPDSDGKLLLCRPEMNFPMKGGSPMGNLTRLPYGPEMNVSMNRGSRMWNMTWGKRPQIEARMQTAITACQDKAEGDACTMAGGPRGNMTGTCKMQNDKLLLCRPEMGNGRQMPPMRWNTKPVTHSK